MGIQLVNHRLVTQQGTGGNSLPGGTVAHGSALTLAKVGPWALQGVSQGSEVLPTPLTSGQLAERLATPGLGDGRPSWISGSAYSYSTSNHGGIVGAGGLTFNMGDFSYTIPAGTWVVQGQDFSNGSVIIQGDNSGVTPAFAGVLFLGCRMRHPYDAVGFFANNGVSPGGPIWFMYCDVGGNSLATADLCQVGLADANEDARGLDHLYVIRCYLSNTTSHVFLRNSGGAAIENYLGPVSDFGFGSTYHLNGIANSGGQTATMWLRNNAVIAPTVVSGGGGYTSTELTDIFQMAADDGTYVGGGTNLDGSSGYQVRDNLCGGANFTWQFGYDTGRGTDCADLHVTGNLVSNSVHVGGGATGLSDHNPDFTAHGNTWVNNVWADGANAGQTISAPPQG